jgi:hypothetical protein
MASSRAGRAWAKTCGANGAATAFKRDGGAAGGGDRREATDDDDADEATDRATDARIDARAAADAPASTANARNFSSRAFAGEIFAQTAPAMTRRVSVSKRARLDKKSAAAASDTTASSASPVVSESVSAYCGAGVWAKRAAKNTTNEA